MIPLIFTIITLLVLLFLYLATGKNKRVLTVSILWMSFIGILAFQDFFKVTTGFPPRFSIVLIGNLAIVIYFFRLLKKTPLHHVYAFSIHALRLPVELMLALLYAEALVPKIMTFYGYNFDILMGISALVVLGVGRFHKSTLSRRFLIIWNYAGLLFLILIVTLAVLSAPLPIQLLAFDQPNIAVLRFPYVLLPAYIVPMVLLIHLLSISHLARE